MFWVRFALHCDYIHGSRGFSCGNSLGKSQNAFVITFSGITYIIIYIYISHGTARGDYPLIIIAVFCVNNVTAVGFTVEAKI